VKILALDTATEACSAAVLIDGVLIAREMEFDRGHAEHILPMVDAVLGEAGITLTAIDALAFGRGPGGFTGVRLAASVAQGLAFAADRPVVPVSDLMAVAQRAFDLAPGLTRMVVCNDARMREVYWACFERGAEGLATLVGVEHVGPPDAVEIWPHWRAGASATARGSSPGKLVEPGAGDGRAVSADDANVALRGARAGAIGAAGRGFRAYPELGAKLLFAAEGTSSGEGAGPLAHLVSDSMLPRAHEIARLAVIEVQAGRAVTAEQAIPVYLRDDVARPQPSRN
jgi:tRNA threonylcarbamoyladenosine biosynthesis protein TsaB